MKLLCRKIIFNTIIETKCEMQIFCKLQLRTIVYKSFVCQNEKEHNNRVDCYDNRIKHEPNLDPYRALSGCWSFSGFPGVKRKTISATKSTGYEPYDHLHFFSSGKRALHNQIRGVREIVSKMNIQDIKVILKHYKEHR